MSLKGPGPWDLLEPHSNLTSLLQCTLPPPLLSSLPLEKRILHISGAGTPNPNCLLCYSRREKSPPPTPPALLSPPAEDVTRFPEFLHYRDATEYHRLLWVFFLWFFIFLCFGCVYLKRILAQH